MTSSDTRTVSRGGASPRPRPPRLPDPLPLRPSPGSDGYDLRGDRYRYRCGVTGCGAMGCQMTGIQR
ncbi:MAG: hypothetical protein R2857_02575 [Vampirovibrionales bacterium]